MFLSRACRLLADTVDSYIRAAAPWLRSLGAVRLMASYIVSRHTCGLAAKETQPLLVYAILLPSHITYND